MKFNDTTVKIFLLEEYQYIIPTYQRAYSWEEYQLRQFLRDLIEHNSCDEMNFYSFGNIMLEQENNTSYNIIDGQQRLTTIYIFLRAILNIAKEKNLYLDDSYPLNVLENCFKTAKFYKLRPVQYDRACFDTIIIENKDEYKPDTLSQERMIMAKKFFINQLQNISSDELKSLYRTLTNSKINKVILSGKREAALMFELQNNRGKDLTNLEKLKSYFMYQLYVYCNPNEAETKISYVSDKFDKIYSIISEMNNLLTHYTEKEDSLSLTEDNVLLYHCHAYSSKLFGYRNLNDLFDDFRDSPIIKNEDQIETGQLAKVKWITDFIDELHTTFSNMKKVLVINNFYFEKLKRLNIPSFVWPFIILGMKYYDDNSNDLSELFRIMEVLSFRYKLIGSRADIRSRCTDVIRDFKQDQDVHTLAPKMENKMNEAEYWSASKLNETLNGNLYGNEVIKYLLWEYEENLQQRKGYTLGKIDKKDESIEHISPQTADDEWIEAGYDVNKENQYEQDFKEQYINCIGNLMMISLSHNSSIGNRPFKNKLETYINNPWILQQKEIQTFVQNNSCPEWKKEQIEQRKKKIVAFANERWKFI